MSEDAKTPGVVILRVDKETGEVEKLTLEEALSKLRNWYQSPEITKRDLLAGVELPSPVARVTVSIRRT